MKIPVLTENEASKDLTEEFKGLDHNIRTAPGEWFNQKNMSTDFYPAASPRGKRSVQQATAESSTTANVDNTDVVIKALAENKGMCYTDGSLYTLHPLKYGDDNKGYWFFKGNEPVNMNIAESHFHFQNANCNKTYNTLTSTFVISNIAVSSNTINVGDVIKLIVQRSAGDVFWNVYENFKVTEVLQTGFVCQKNGVGWSETFSGVELTVVNITTQMKNLYESSKPEYFNKDDNSYRSVIRMGANLCTFPDGVIYETSNTDEALPMHKIEESLTLESLKDQTKGDSKIYITCAVKTNNGYNVNFGGSSNTFASSKWRIADGTLQEYLTDNELWVNARAYTLIYYGLYYNINGTSQGAPELSNTFGRFKKGDVVTITVNDNISSGNLLKGIFEQPDNEATKYPSISKKIVDMGKWSDGREYIVLEGLSYAQITADNATVQKRVFEAENITLQRKMPEIKFACESQNRIWVCSKDGHEIYASALGDPYTFYDYSGLSTDSYAVNVGSDGLFTGCVNYLGRPLFFKENTLHIISGSYPSNGGEFDGLSYSVDTLTQFKGVEKGSERSLAIIDNILYYKSAAGIVAYDGANTVVISDPLGKERYKNAVAGAHNNKYYVSMQDSQNTWHMFVYDTERGTWCKEDNAHVLEFINVNNELLYLSADDNMIYSVCEEDVLFNQHYHKEDNFEWMCETGNIGYSYPNNKYISRLQIRMQITDGARATLFIQYDSDGIWHRKGEMTGKGIKTHLFPIVPVRCDHMKIKIEGSGDVKIISIAKVLEEGGDY